MNTPPAVRQALWQQAWQTRARHYSPRIQFDRPLSTLAVSVTGTACALRCAHCNGHYLASMRALSDPALARAQSLLISGGCDRQGRVPAATHLPEIVRVGAGKRLNWHVGLIEEDTARVIAPHASVISFDFVGDDHTIREVYGLERTVDDYVATYQMLRRHARVVPHVTVGLLGGQLSGERRALELLQGLGAEALVVIVFIPTPGTRYAHRPPPPADDVVDLLAEARVRFPDTPLFLGCMRPAGQYRDQLDPLAVQVGVNKIVNPSRTAVAAATALGLTVDWGEECCAL